MYKFYTITFGYSYCNLGLTVLNSVINQSKFKCFFKNDFSVPKFIYVLHLSVIEINKFLLNLNMISINEDVGMSVCWSLINWETI